MHVILQSIRALQQLDLLSEVELLSALQIDNAQVRWFLTKALCSVNPQPRTIGFLVNQVTDPSLSPALRSMVASNLAAVADERINGPLIGMLSDENPNVRQKVQNVQMAISTISTYPKFKFSKSPKFN